MTLPPGRATLAGFERYELRRRELDRPREPAVPRRGTTVHAVTSWRRANGQPIIRFGADHERALCGALIKVVTKDPFEPDGEHVCARCVEHFRNGTRAPAKRRRPRPVDLVPTGTVRTEELVSDDGEASTVHYVYCAACNGYKSGDCSDEFTATSWMVEHNRAEHDGATQVRQQRFW